MKKLLIMLSAIVIIAVGGKVVIDTKQKEQRKVSFEKTYDVNVTKLKNKITFDSTEEDGLIGTKRYKQLSELESDIGYSILHSTYFTNSKYNVMYVKELNYSQVFFIPQKKTH